MSQMSATGGRSSVSDDSDKHDVGCRRVVRVEGGVTLSRPILHCANRGLRGVEFHRESSQVLPDFSGSDAVQNVTEPLFACALLDPGAWVVMHGRALRSPEVAKDRDRMTFVQRDE